MIPDEYVGILNPYLLPRGMWAPPIAEIIDFISKHKLANLQKLITEYLLQLYRIVYRSEKIHLVHKIASVIYSYVHSTKGYEYEYLSMKLDVVAPTVFEIEKTLSFDKHDSEIQLCSYLDLTTAAVELPITPIHELGKPDNLTAIDLKLALSQIMSSLKLIVLHRLGQIGHSESEVDFPSEILKIPQLFLRKKRNLFKFSGSAQKSEPIHIYSLLPYEEYTWIETGERPNFNENPETVSVVDMDSTLAKQSFENELKNANPVKITIRSKNYAYFDEQFHEKWGADSPVTPVSVVTPVKVGVSMNYKVPTDAEIIDKIKENTASDIFTGAVSTAIRKQAGKCNTARTISIEPKIVERDLEEERYSDTKIRKRSNNNPDAEMRFEFFQMIMPWTVYIVLTDMELILSNGITVKNVQFSEPKKILELLADPAVKTEKSAYELLIEALSELELEDFEKNIIKPFTLTNTIKYQGKSYPCICLNLPKRTVSESGDNKAFNQIKGLILAKDHYYMRTKTTFEETRVLKDNLLSETRSREMQAYIDKLYETNRIIKLENERKAMENKMMGLVFANFDKLDSESQKAAILARLAQNLGPPGSMFEKMVYLLKKDDSKPSNDDTTESPE